jgi:hypothetical protein
MVKNIKRKPTRVRIHPRYIKDAQGKTVQVYLDINAYEAMLKRIAEFQEIKKNIQPKR